MNRHKNAPLNSAKTLLEATLDYAAHGLHVFPIYGITDAGSCDCGDPKCNHPGKHPMTPNGFRDATTDTDQIKGWRAGWGGLFFIQLAGVGMVDAA